MSEKFNLEISMSNLYDICLKFFQKLFNENHPKIELIMIILDKLIELKQKETLSEEEKIKEFDLIHSLAYNNINEVYDYDLENKNKNKNENENENENKNENENIKNIEI
jgi:hypothetical protein